MQNHRVSGIRSLAWAAIICLSALANAFAQTSVGPRQSSPIALTADDQILVNVNPDSNSLTAFEFLAAGNLKKIAEIPVGRDPNSVALHPNGTKAYVANSLDGTVSVVDLNTLSVISQFPVGAEPMAAALSSNGTRLYVANSSSNDLMQFNTATTPPSFLGTIDLSSYGTAPRAIGITNDGDADDTDETIFVALFFGQLRPGKTSVEEGQDDQREGRVVGISAATFTVLGSPNPIQLAPVANTGFNSNGQLAPGPAQVPAVPSTNPQTFTTPTGCFPNQLADTAIRPATNLAYVVNTCASPNGPLRFNSMAQGLVSVFNTATRTEVTAGQTDPSVRRTAPLNLNQGINLATTPAPRLFLTNPVAMTWRPDGSDAWVVIQNTNVVVRLTVDGGGIPTINAPLVSGPSMIVRVDLQDVPSFQIPGKAPRGITTNNLGTRAFVYNFVSRSVTAIDISNPLAPVISDTAQASQLPAPNTPDATAQLGAELFFTGRGPQERMSSESWGGCIVCHPQGRSDNVTWMFDAGPGRLSRSMACLIKPTTSTSASSTGARSATRIRTLN